MRNALIIRGGAAPLLADAKLLTTIDGANIPLTLAAARGMIMHLYVVVISTFGDAHSNTSAVGDFVDEMVAHEDNIDKAKAQDTRCSSKLPKIILRWYHIRWMEWVRKQWDSTSPIMVPTFEAL